MCDCNCDYIVYGSDTHLMCLFRLEIFVYFLTIASGLFTMIVTTLTAWTQSLQCYSAGVGGDSTVQLAWVVLDCGTG